MTDGRSGRRAARAQSAQAPTSRSATEGEWFEEEPRLGITGRGLLERIMARGRFSWPIWAAVAVVLAGAATVMRLRRPPDYEVTVVLQVTEGVLGPNDADGADLGNGALRALVYRLAFSRPNLIALMARHPDAFPPAADTDLALMRLRDQTDVQIAQNEFMEWHERDDPPRSVQMAVSYRSQSPEQALTMASALAQLVIDTARGRTRSARNQERAAADEALAQAGDRAEFGRPTELSLLEHPKLGTGAQRRLAEVTREATAAEILAAAAGEEQTLKFEVVEPGRLPRPHTSEAALIAGGASLIALLLVGWLLAGAFDPRVLLPVDISQAGLTVLGALPPLPTAPSAAVREASDG